MNLLACQQKETTTEAPESQDSDSHRFKFKWEAIANKIVAQASPQPGEKILLVAKPGEFDSLILYLKKKIDAAKGQYLGTISVNSEAPEAWNTEFTRVAASKSGKALAEHFRTVDLGIMLPGADTTHVPYAAMQEVLRNGNGRTIHFHWAGAYQLNGSLLARTEFVDELYQTAFLGTDYTKLAQHLIKFEDAARNSTIRITTPLGSDIQFIIGDRPVTKQDGNASRARSDSARNFIDREVELPAGAIRVAPIEKSVNGVIVFPDTQWNGTTVKGLTMQFKEGKVINVKAAEGLDAVKSEQKKAGPSASSFRELAVGFNPQLAIPQIGPQWIPYYGYGAGVIRLSLGDNSELGGNVRGKYVRWNFFIDATLRIGDEVWIRDGRVVQAF